MSKYGELKVERRGKNRKKEKGEEEGKGGSGSQQNILKICWHVHSVIFLQIVPRSPVALNQG
jgi:hypothetical protein